MDKGKSVFLQGLEILADQCEVVLGEVDKNGHWLTSRYSSQTDKIRALLKKEPRIVFEFESYFSDFGKTSSHHILSGTGVIRQFDIRLKNDIFVVEILIESGQDMFHFTCSRKGNAEATWFFGKSVIKNLRFWLLS